MTQVFSREQDLINAKAQKLKRNKMLAGGKVPDRVISSGTPKEHIKQPNIDYAVKHSAEVRDANNNDYTELTKRTFKEFDKNDKDNKIRREKLKNG